MALFFVHGGRAQRAVRRMKMETAGSGRIGATVDNERSETPGELNAGDRGNGEEKKERPKVSKLIRAPSLLAVTM